MVSVMVLLPLSGCVSTFALMGLCFAVAIKDQHVNSFANLPAGAHKLAFPLVAQDTTMPDMGARAAPVIIVTGAFISLLYVFYYAQSLTVNLTFARLRKQNLQSKDKQRVKLDDVKYGTAGGRNVLAANRTVGNTLEQAIPFLASLWMHAVFLNVRRATFIGWLYIATRLIYPLVFVLNVKTGGAAIFASTLPGYACVLALLAPVLLDAADVSIDL